MRRMACIRAVVAVVVGGWFAGPAVGGERAAGPNAPVLMRRGECQLFVDDWLIASSEGLRRTLHAPVKENGGREPVIAPPAGGRALLAQTGIFRDTRRGCYVLFGVTVPEGHGYLFTSKDGLAWRFGDDGRAEPVRVEMHYPGGEPPEDSYYGLTAHFDEADNAWPWKGWFFAGNWGPDLEGFYYVRSKDGTRWEQRELVVPVYAGPGDPSCVRIDQDGQTVYGPGDTTSFYYDRVEDRFLGLFKFFTTERVGPGNNLRSRAFAFLERLDKPFDITRLKRVDLLPPAAAKGGDRPYDEYYTSSAYRYGGQWLGELAVWHRGDDYPWSAAGCSFAKLVVSRDGLHWRKVPFVNDEGIAEVFIPNGPQGGNGGRNDGGYMSLFDRGPLRIGDELVYYYGLTSWGKTVSADRRISGGGIFRARLRLDGFVSVDAGTLTTRPLRFEGGRLFVNAVGPVRVAVIDTGGGVRGTAEIAGDSVRHAVSFGGRSLGALVGEGPARLRFGVGASGRLYSFQVE
jgi:hypothetical protein